MGSPISHLLFEKNSPLCYLDLNSGFGWLAMELIWNHLESNVVQVNLLQMSHTLELITLS